ncbi:MAG TPA: metalloregulator ArsR/SmtB family transcription factor [Ktedonobacteraceae bacterium]|jgi:DNA-binding transcriptional ArsR family regulator/dienelactone hydrolase
MSQDEFQALLQFFKVLADENRLKLLGILAAGEHSVEELAALLQLRAPTISHHLAKLKELDLVRMRSEGNTHYYHLDTEALRRTNKQLLTPEKIASLVQDIEGDAWEQKVLRDFFEGSRLKEIPASRKKRSVILKWFANQFTYGVLYKEPQVNEIIQHHHEDASALRRELISTKEMLMQRENGFYWRIPSGENWRSAILRSTDRQPLQIWLGTPHGSGPFPTILELHEGLEFTQPDWLSPLAQTWVEAGFAYMVINYPAPAPGSYALSFHERVAGNPGNWELEDLLTARSWLLEQNIVDPGRILLAGWSYSAFVVLLAMGKPPEMWAGAIAGAPVIDWLQEYEVASDKTSLQALFSGSPEEKRAQYITSSPVEYVSSIRAPLLLLQSENVSSVLQEGADRYIAELRGRQPLSALHRYSGKNLLDIEQMVEQQKNMLNFARRIV